jgi:RNA polymerase sigma-70 factor (ECF subfamily)
VLLLRDVFDYDYARIAEIIGKSEVACRQLALRARAHLLERRPRFEADATERDALAERFFQAIEAGDLTGLEAVLASDVALHGDGGGRVPALARAVHGRREVARTLFGWARAGARAGGFVVERTTVNGQAGALIRSAQGPVVGVWALDVSEGRIHTIRSIVNPEKLRHIPDRGNLGEWLGVGDAR